MAVPILVVLLLARDSFADPNPNTLLNLLGLSLKLPEPHYKTIHIDEPNSTWRNKRNPFGISARGFHDDVFSRDFGSFQPYKRSTISESGERPKREISPADSRQEIQDKGHKEVVQKREISNTLRMPEKRALSFYRRSWGYPKRRPTDDFHGDAFTQGFGDFNTMRKRRPSDDFHGDTFTQGFGDFATMKRRPESDFHDDIFTQGFGDFDTMRKRRPSDDFHGDTFTHGFGDFTTMRKRRPSDDFHGDTFTQGFGDFETMRKRRPESDFHDDIFTQGFGDFDTMKKRRPTEDFNGDTFTQGFGDFSTMRKRTNDVEDKKTHSIGSPEQLPQGNR